MEGQELEKPTTTIIIDRDMADAIIIAMQDCIQGCENRIRWAETELMGERSKEKTIEAEEIEALSEFTLTQIPKILQEIKEVYPELEERDEAQQKSKIITIEKPTWGHKA